MSLIYEYGFIIWYASCNLGMKPGFPSCVSLSPILAHMNAICNCLQIITVRNAYDKYCFMFHVE